MQLVKSPENSRDIGPMESIHNWVEPKVLGSCRAVDARISQVSKNVLGLCHQAAKPGFLYQKPANSVVYSGAHFAKCVAPIGILLYFGPVGVYGALLLLPIVKQLAFRGAAVAGNVASHAALAFLGFGTFLERVEKSRGSNNEPFSVAVLGTMAGDAVSMGISDYIYHLPYDRVVKAVGKVGIVTPVKLFAKASSQIGYNALFAQDPKDYKRPMEYLSLRKLVEEISCAAGYSSSHKWIHLDDFRAQFLLDFGAGTLAILIVKFVAGHVHRTF